VMPLPPPPAGKKFSPDESPPPPSGEFLSNRADFHFPNPGNSRPATRNALISGRAKRRTVRALGPIINPAPGALPARRPLEGGGSPSARSAKESSRPRAGNGICPLNPFPHAPIPFFGAKKGNPQKSPGSSEWGQVPPAVFSWAPFSLEPPSPSARPPPRAPPFTAGPWGDAQTESPLGESRGVSPIPERRKVPPEGWVLESRPERFPVTDGVCCPHEFLTGPNPLPVDRPLEGFAPPGRPPPEGPVFPPLEDEE